MLASAIFTAGEDAKSGVACVVEYPLATFDNEAALAPVGNYDGLDYAGLKVITLGVDGNPPTTGVLPQSGTNVAVSALISETESGSPVLTINAPYQSFSMKYIYFGCAVDTVAPQTGVPQACSVQFTAYKAGSGVAYQTIVQQFDPASDTTSKMVQVQFPTAFGHLGKMEISVIGSPTGTTLPALPLDNAKYSLNCEVGGRG